MNSHDSGVAYAIVEHTVQQRANQIADITDAIQHGFKAEPDLAPHHLPLLSGDALARIFDESKKWRDKARERELEAELLQSREEEKVISDHYVRIREILGALDVPHHFMAIDMNPRRHIAWTEQTARGLVEKADASERNRKAATDAEHRLDLLDRYVKACDDKRIPYNWNVFKMPIGTLRETVYNHEGMEPCSNCDVNHEKVKLFETRQKQDLEQSLRWHAQRADNTRKLIEQYAGGRIPHGVAERLLDALLDRPQTGEQTPAWTTWEWGYAPKDITRDTLLELRLKSGDVVILDSSVVEWADVEAYRPAK